MRDSGKIKVYTTMAATVCALTALPLGVLGYVAAGESLLNGFYMTLQFFALGDPYPDAAKNFMLHVARLLAAAAVSLAVVMTVMSLCADVSRRYFAQSWRNHDIVCGLGNRGINLVHQLAATHQCESVKDRIKAAMWGDRAIVAIERNEQNPHLQTARRAGALVIVGDATNPNVLHDAAVRSAARLFSCCGKDDDTDVAVTLAAVDEAAKSTRTKQLHICPEINDPTIRTLIRQYAARQKHEGRSVLVHPFDNNELSARRLLADYPLDHDRQLGLTSFKHAQLVIIGFGPLGQAVLLQAMHVGHFANRSVLRVTLIDPDIDTLYRRFVAAHPNLGRRGLQRPARIRRRGMHPLDPRLCMFLNDIADNPEAVVTVVVCLGVATEAVRLVDQTRRATAADNVRLLVRVPNNRGFGRLLHPESEANREVDGVAFPNVYDFSPATDIDPAAIRDEHHDKLAQAIHHAYRTRTTFGENLPDAKPQQRPWNELDEIFRISNRAAADFVPLLWRTFGFEIIAAKSADQRNRVKEVPSHLHEVMAQLEHERWCSERFLSGWQRDAVRDDSRRRHPDLVPWATLDAASKQHNRDQVSSHVTILSQIGYVVLPA